MFHFYQQLEPTVVELTRHERGLLKLQLAPDLLASDLHRHLVIVDLYGTGAAIDDKLQVSFYLLEYDELVVACVSLLDVKPLRSN